jgi:hypothetical protein
VEGYLPLGDLRNLSYPILRTLVQKRTLLTSRKSQICVAKEKGIAFEALVGDETRIITNRLILNLDFFLKWRPIGSSTPSARKKYLICSAI